MLESLIGVIPGNPLKQESISDSRADKLFKYLWNEKYPEYPVRIQWNAHDFGSYPDIGISQNLFNASYNDSATFPNGIEDAAFQLVDQWNANIDSVTADQWQAIREATGIEDEKFQMEY